MTTTTAQKLYTPPQHAYIAKLTDQRVVPVAGKDTKEAELIARYEDMIGNAAVYNGETCRIVTLREASAVIDWLKTLPLKQEQPTATPGAVASRPTAPAELTPGIYEVDDVVYVVKFNQPKTRLYACRLVEIGGERVTEAGTFVNVDYQYEAGAIYRITSEHKVSFDRAKALNIRYGVCLMCKAKIKARKSVLALAENGGFGPVCVTYVR
jgi:hypothetical protein